MGYLFAFFSVLAGTGKGYCGKKTSQLMEKPADGIFISMIRMFFCSLVGLVFGLADGNGSFFMDAEMLLVTLLSAAATSFFVISWLVCVRSGTYMMLDIFLLMGVVIPVTGSAIVFHEAVPPAQVVGILILGAAVYLLSGYNKAQKGKMTWKNAALLAFCGCMNGIADFSQKLFVKQNAGANAAVFHFYTYLFSFLLLLAMYLIMGGREKRLKNDRLIQMGAYILVMAVCLFLNSFFKTLAANRIDATQLYPLCQGGSLLLSSLMASFLFREKLNRKGSLGIVLAFAGLLVINLL